MGAEQLLSGDERRQMPEKRCIKQGQANARPGAPLCFAASVRGGLGTAHTGPDSFFGFLLTRPKVARQRRGSRLGHFTLGKERRWEGTRRRRRRRAPSGRGRPAN